MVKSRKGKVAETKARLKALKKKRRESSNKQLCCNVNPARACYRCPTRYCTDHLKKVSEGDGLIYYIRGKFVCHRCLSIELLFGDM